MEIRLLNYNRGYSARATCCSVLLNEKRSCQGLSCTLRKEDSNESDQNFASIEVGEMMVGNDYRSIDQVFLFKINFIPWSL